MSREGCSADEWTDLVDWIQTRWKRSTWSEPKPRRGEDQAPSRAESLYDDFKLVPARAIRQAIEAWFDEGQPSPPQPSQLRRLALDIAKKGIPADADPEDPAWCQHVWEITADSEAPGFRNLECVRCHKIETRLAHEAPTVGEVEERRRDLAVSGEPDLPPNEEVWV